MQLTLEKTTQQPHSTTSLLSILDIEKKLSQANINHKKPAIYSTCQFMRLCHQHLYTHHIINSDLSTALSAKGPKIFVAQHSTWTLDILLSCLYYLSEIKDIEEANNFHFIVDDFTLALPILGEFFKSVGANNARYAQIKQLLHKDCSIFVFPGGGPEWVSSTGQAQWTDFPRAQGIFRAAHEVSIEKKTTVKIFPIASAGTENLYRHVPLNYISKAIWQHTGLPFFICLGRAGLPFDANVLTKFLAPINITQDSTPAEFHTLILENPATDLKKYNQTVRNHRGYAQVIQATTIKTQDRINEAHLQLLENLPPPNWKQTRNNYGFNILLLGAVSSITLLGKQAQNKVLQTFTLAVGLPTLIFLIVFFNNFYQIIPHLKQRLSAQSLKVANKAS